MNSTIQIDKSYRQILGISGIIAIPVIGLIDYLTGPEISFSIFYLIPISGLTWLLGWRTGAVSALASAIVLFVAELLWMVPYSQPAVPYWNATVRLGIFIVIAFLLAKLRELNQGLESQVEEKATNLRESEEHFRAVFEQAAVGIAEADATSGRLLRVNQGFCEIVGYTEAELLERSFQDITHPDDVEIDLNYRRRMISDEIQTYSLEKQYIRKDESYVWVSVTVSLVRRQMNTPAYFIVFVRDISDRKQAEEQAQRQLKNLNALRMIDIAISSSFDLHITLDTVLQQVIARLGVDASAVLLYNPHLRALEYVARQGFHANSPGHTLKLDQSFAGKAVLQRETIHVTDFTDSDNQFIEAMHLKNEAFVEYYGVPLIIKGEIKGVLEIYNRSRFNPDKEWLNFLETLAGQTAIAIDSGQLFESLERSNLDLRLAYDATIEGWSHAMDLRDKETEGHTQRVTSMTMSLAQSMQMKKHNLIHARRGALLHDMGKLGIPDSILLKPDKLTDEEWDVMRQHPQFAYDMLSDIYYLKPALDIPYCHHEKWDGTGYPRALKGEEIPLPARVFAVADVWDALTSDRPYRKAWTEEQAMKYIIEQSGKHFDPQVVKAFIEMMESA